MNRKKKMFLCVCVISMIGLTAVWYFWSDLTHSGIFGEPVMKIPAEELQRTVVTAHLEEKIEDGTNVLWCSTFQLAWNELCSLAGGPIRMKDEPAMVTVLNKQAATKDDIDQASCVAMAGIIGDGIIEKIKEELAQKFQGKASPELLPLTEGLPPNFWVAYSYLFKMLRFKYAFVLVVGRFGESGYSDAGDSVPPGRLLFLNIPASSRRRRIGRMSRIGRIGHENNAAGFLGLVCDS